MFHHFLGLAPKGLMYYFPGQILKTVVKYHVNHTHFLAEETINLLVTCPDIFLQDGRVRRKFEKPGK